jgi:uncharacterized membrane protein
MASNRSQLVELIRRGAIAPDTVDQAVAVLELYPNGKAWRTLLDQLLLWLASLSLGLSALFFIAYNWSALGRFARFGLVEAGLLVAVAAYWRFGHQRAPGQAILLFASVLVGVLLALVGQVYQTGADPWQLFFIWALLISPWAILGQFAALWVVWVALINLSLLLYFQAFGIFGSWSYSSQLLFWLLFTFNALVLALWELAALHLDWLAVDWARRLVAMGSGVSITVLAFLAIVSNSTGPALHLVVYGLWLAVMYGVYRRLKPDLFMLAGCCLSAIVVVTAFLANATLRSFEIGGFFLLALAVLTMGALSVNWLKRINQEAGP